MLNKTIFILILSVVVGYNAFSQIDIIQTNISKINSIDSISIFSLLPGFLAFDESEITENYIIENGAKGFLFQTTSYELKSEIKAILKSSIADSLIVNPDSLIVGGCRTVIITYNIKKEEVNRIALYWGSGNQFIVRNISENLCFQINDRGPLLHILKKYFPVFF